jgi:hypothetical protein
MATTLQRPDGSLPIPIPSRLEPVFREIDNHGIYSVLKGNGKFDFLDYPLPAVGTKIVSYLVEKKYQLTDQEKSFLENELGMSNFTEDSMDFDLRVLGKWANRWTLVGLPKPKKKQASNKPLKIRVVVESKSSLSKARLDEAKDVLRVTLLNLSRVVDLDPSEIPTTIRVTALEGDAGLALVNHGKEHNRLMKPFKKRCEKLVSVLFSSNKTPGRKAKKVNKSEKKLTEDFSKLFLEPRRPQELLIGSDLFEKYFIAYYKFFEDNPDKSNDRDVLIALSSPLAFLMAHELGHGFQGVGSAGGYYVKKKQEIMRSSMQPNMSWATSFFEYCAAGLGGDRLLEFEDSGQLEAFLKPGTLDKIVKVNYDQEIDVTVLGFYATFVVGYDVSMFDQIFQADLQPSFTHPGTKQFKDWTNWLVEQFPF